MRRNEKATSMQKSRLRFPENQANATWSESCDEPITDEDHPLQQTLRSPLRAKRCFMLQGNAGSIRAPRSPPQGRSDRSFQEPSPKLQRRLTASHKLAALLGTLRTDDFVGEIDPEYHSPYLSASDSMLSKSNRSLSVTKRSQAKHYVARKSSSQWKPAIKKIQSTSSVRDES